MTTQQPTDTSNLDQYGNEPLLWDDIVERLQAAAASGDDLGTVLGTVRPDGRPHAAMVGASWIDGAWYVVSDPGTQKSKNLDHNPACTLSVRLPGFDVVFNATADRVTDAVELEGVASVYRQNGWPAAVDGEGFTAPFTAPSGGPPPWSLYRLACDSVVAVGGSSEQPGATKWSFA